MARRHFRLLLLDGPRRLLAWNYRIVAATLLRRSLPHSIAVNSSSFQILAFP